MSQDAIVYAEALNDDRVKGHHRICHETVDISPQSPLALREVSHDDRARWSIQSENAVLLVY